MGQKAWIFTATLRDNIVFGNAFKVKWYDKVIHACALRPDLKQLAHGDMTVIGERGVNLSGGQRARVALARAVYATRAGSREGRSILLCDDPLSAVDSVVAQHIFNHVFDDTQRECICKHTLRIFVTHQTQFLPRTHTVIVMKKGHITHCDSYQHLISTPA